jgi:hypothetical protein
MEGKTSERKKRLHSNNPIRPHRSRPKRGVRSRVLGAANRQILLIALAAAALFLVLLALSNAFFG